MTVSNATRGQANGGQVVSSCLNDKEATGRSSLSSSEGNLSEREESHMQ